MAEPRTLSSMISEAITDLTAAIKTATVSEALDHLRWAQLNVKKAIDEMERRLD